MFLFQTAVVQNLAVLLSASSGGGGGVGAVAVLLECGCYKLLGAAAALSLGPGLSRTAQRPALGPATTAMPATQARHGRGNASLVSFLRKFISENNFPHCHQVGFDSIKSLLVSTSSESNIRKK